MKPQRLLPLALLLIHSSVLAQPAPAAPVESSLRGTTVTPQWQLQLGAMILSSPILAQVNGLGDHEIVVTTFCPSSACPGNPNGGGRVFVLETSGTILPGWPQASADAPFTGEAVVGDLDADGNLEVVAGSWNQAFVWNHEGSLRLGWPKSIGTFAAPALADLDADGDLEILYSSTDGKLYAWHHNGTDVTGWPYTWTGGTGSGHIMSPAVADVDGDGAPEILAGTGQAPYTNVPHDFFIWEDDGSVKAGFPVSTLYQGTPPAVGDLDGDNTLETVFSGGGFAGEDTLYLIDPSGAARPGWPVTAMEVSDSAPALGDLDGDGSRDIVIGGAEIVNQTCEAPRLYAFNQQGSALTGFPVNLPLSGGGICPVFSPIVLADMDGDEDLEAVVKYRDTVAVYQGDGTPMVGFPFVLSDDDVSSNAMPGPAVDDVDNDGQLEFLFASVSGRLAFFDTTTATSRGTRVWPMSKHDPLGTSDLGILNLFSDGFESGDLDQWSSRVP